MKNRSSDYDILIIGAGVIGLSFALSMAKTKLKIGIIESATQVSWDNQQEESRVSAITLSSKKFFEEIGIWEDINQMRISPFSNMKVWDNQGGGYIEFDSLSIGFLEMGYIIENAVIQVALQNKLKSFSNVEIICKTCLRWQRHENYHQIFTSDDTRYDAELIIGADGKKSWLREQLKIPTDYSSYQQTAIVAKVKTSLSHQKTAWQHFLPTGPLAFLPLQSEDNQHCSIVWSVKNESVDEIMAMDDETFCQHLSKAFGDPLGFILGSTPRMSFALEKMSARHYVKPGVALIGDSAHCIHPLAGQGLNQGLLDVMCLSKILKEAIAKEKSFTSEKRLRRYERHRKVENEMMSKLMDGFNGLFSNDNKFLSYIRSQGLSFVNQLPMVKDLILGHM